MPLRPIAVYTADREFDGFDELYAADDTGAQVRLSGASLRSSDALHWRARVRGFVWSPDRAWVAFTADLESPGWFQLFVVPANGGEPRRVSPDSVALQDLALKWQWSPDSARLAFQARRAPAPGADGWDELFVWTVADPVHAVRVSSPMTINAGVVKFSWSPDGRRIAYYANPADDQDYRIFTVRPDGTGHVAVSGPFAVWSPAPWSPDASHLAWWAHDGTKRSFTLRTSRADGGSPMILGSHAYGDLGVRFEWSPVAGRLAYQNFEDGWSGSDVYAVDADGSGKVKLSPDGTDAFSVRWSPDGARLSFGVGQDGFWTCGPWGENRLRVGRASVEWAPDGRWIALMDSFDAAGVQELYVLRPDGSERVKVSGPLIADGDVTFLRWSPGGSRIAYLADALRDQVFELYCVNREGGSPAAKVSGPLVSGGSISAYLWTADGNAILYRADQETDEQYELYLARPDGTAPLKLSGTLPGFADVSAFAAR